MSMKPGDMVKLDDRQKWANVYCDSDCYRVLITSIVTRSDLGVVLQIHWHKGFETCKVLLPNGSAGWIKSKYLEVIQ